MNEVGYSTATVDAGKQIALAAQFENVAGGEIAVKDVLTSSNPTAGTTFATADQIWRWVNNEWKQYFLSKYSSRSGTIDGWVTKESAGKEEVTTDTIKAGETFFYINKGKVEAAITLAGGVKAFTAVPAYSIDAGKQIFMGYPWPQKLAVAGFEKYCSNPTAGTTFATADQIWRWGKDNEWKQYFFSKYSSRSGTIDGWVTKESAGKEEVTIDEIDVGEGFFFINKGKVEQTITFTNPIK